MSDETSAPSNAEILAALQGMWRQQKDLVHGVETRLGSRVEAAAEKLAGGLRAAEERLGERLAQEIRDRPVVVH